MIDKQSRSLLLFVILACAHDGVCSGRLIAEGMHDLAVSFDFTRDERFRVLQKNTRS